MLPDMEEFLALHADAGNELREFLADYLAVERLSPRRAPTSSASPDTTDRIAGGKYSRLALPSPFGDFELLEEIARGGMGIVYKVAANHTSPDRRAEDDPGRSTCFRCRHQTFLCGKAQAVATLDHANIVPVFEVGNCEGQHYFSDALHRGRKPVRKVGSRTSDGARGCIAHPRCRPCGSLCSHARHRSSRSKPANILIDQDSRARVTDFGLASRKSDETRLTHTGQLLGTPNFMPPEQLAGRVEDIGPAADVYSLVCTLYAILTGRPPFQAASMADTLRQVAEREPVALRQLDIAIPRDLETIVLKCLEKSALRRYATSQNLAEDLERFLTDRPIVARRSSQRERFVRWARRNPLAAGLTACWRP